MRQIQEICHKAFLVGAVALAPAALAETELEEVIVTGSFIKGTPGDAPSPVQTLSRDDIVVSGVSDASELIRNLKIASGFRHRGSKRKPIQRQQWFWSSQRKPSWCWSNSDTGVDGWQAFTFCRPEARRR